MSEVDVAAVVEKVLARLQAPAPTAGSGQMPARPRGVFDTIDRAADAARSAQQVLIALPLEKRREIIAAIRRTGIAEAQVLARMARDETGMGRFEDKVKKNLLVLHRTPGPEILDPISWSGDDGLTLVERAPFGVIGSITPSTNPTETILNNTISMVSGGNTVVFNAHPGARECSIYAVDLINRASISVGGPENLVTTVAHPTLATADALMKHPGIRVIVVTGGGAVVKAAMGSGKKCVAAGPGNPPVVVDETANLDIAAAGIVLGASFDNNVICVDEKEVLAVNGIFDELLQKVEAKGAVRIRNHQITRLEKVVLTPDRAHVNRAWVGKDAGALLREIDVPFQGDPRLVVCEVPFDHPFVQHELLMPVLPFVRVKDVHEGIDLALAAEHGYGHTASMYSRNLDSLHRMARAFNGSIFVKNGPHVAGLGFGGEGYTSFTIASPTGDGLTTARTFTRERRCTLSGYFRIV